jgi:hypothetical protein
VSAQLAGITKRGVLGASICFTRPDAGNGLIGGPALVAAAYSAVVRPLGLVINDALGNAFENTPGVASGKLPYLTGLPCVGVSLWESQRQIGGNTALTYSAGQRLYASVNGLLTNRLEDAYEYNVSGQNDADFVTVMGVVKLASDANNALMVVDMRV